MNPLELLKEIDAWLSFNTAPSKEQIASMRQSIQKCIAEQNKMKECLHSEDDIIEDRYGYLSCGLCGKYGEDI